MSKEDGVRLAEEVDKLQHDLFNGGFSSHHLVGDAVNLLDISGNRNLGIDEGLKGGQLATVQSKAYGADFDQPVHDREEGCGLSVEGEKGEVGQKRLRISYGPRRHCISALCVCTAPERALSHGKWLPAFFREGEELHSG